jgi:DEAD/DEAH box helicase
MLASQAELDELYERLIVRDCGTYVPIVGLPDRLFSDAECSMLLFYASSLALSAGGSREGATSGRRAYDIATRLLKFANGNRQALGVASDYILSRMGNFPARSLVRSGSGAAPEVARINPYIALDILARESDNSPDQGEGLLTDFQVKLLGMLASFQSVSFSAPTSAGKSTALELEIIRRLRSSVQCLVLLVPTRALIRQVTFDLVALLNRETLTDIPVISAPDPGQIQAARSVVCVFTQERLQTLLTNGEWKRGIDTLIVDEAQEIGEGSRGQILELTVLQVLNRYPRCAVFFSSPLRSNPEYLLSTVERVNNSAFFVEHSSPVTQNIFLIRPIPQKTKHSTVSIWFDGTERRLGNIDLPFTFRGTRALADFAVLLTKPEDSSIIYAGEPSKAQDLAVQIADQLPESRNSATDELTTFVREQIHRDYVLAEVVTKGVGFHYGKLPQIIRAKVEDLLRDRHVRFVCCTSTLLQGVNLPTKNIFIENPKKGRGQPMTPSDFWNLVGRAGRLAKEFQGNIFCIYGQPWETTPFGDTRFFPLESAFHLAATKQASTLLQVAQQPPDSSESDVQWAEQALARIFVQYTERGEEIAASKFSNPANHRVLQAIDEECKRFARQKTLPSDLYQNNPYMLPQRLDKLAEFFRGKPDLAAWIPPNPFVRQNYLRYEPIFDAIETLFLRRQFDRHKYFTVLALQWMTGASLRQLIQNRLDFKKIVESDKRKINSEIRGLFEDIEDELRYTYVKYFKVYTDVLRAVLVERGLADLQQRIPPVHLYLEYGAASVTLINLMALGLSRTSAVLLRSHYALGNDLSTRECQMQIDRIDLRSSTLPGLCKAEIARLRRH